MNSEYEMIFKRIQYEVVYLFARWIYFKTLYCKSDKRTDLLKSSANSFFFHLRHILYSDIELLICKLLDPTEQGKYENLSLQQLINRIEESEENLKDKLLAILKELETDTKEIRKRRNERHTHLDFESHINEKKDKYITSSQEEIEIILDKIKEYMNLIQLKYKGSETGYENFSSTGDAEALIRCLKKSESYDIITSEVHEMQIDPKYYYHDGPYKDA